MKPATGIIARSIVGITPFEYPDSALCVALCRAGALGVLDLGRDIRVARTALAAVAAQVPGEFGIRIPEGVTIETSLLPTSAAAVITSDPSDVSRFSAWRPVLAQVTSLSEAVAAKNAGASGLIAKGSESGGRVGEETAFVLLQLVKIADLGLPMWLQGGIGIHTAAVARAGGAQGVVLDAQLATVRESATPESIKTVLALMDGSETTIIAGYRVYTRPDLPAAKAGSLSRKDVLTQLGGRDLHRQLIPAGQDASLAAPMARRFCTAGGVVRGLSRAVDRHLRQAQAASPLAPGSSMARAHGLRFPIAQGPMTRVSDGAEFAWSVANAGGLPFLALSLLGGKEVRRLLEETRARLGDLTFGVGILGFVPPELREEQLKVVEEIRPRVALIAGGRPDQAKGLEAQGIETYLHVPSPALLDLFLAEGSRRFVFEGRECGGHVGPRSSLVLWEQMVERLLAHPAPEELSVFFAGGIHNALSAAMVGALSAPLAAAGTRLGILMGTAYLFTEEAVSSGAITAAFQEAALSCDRTVLLETAPGHATRCVESEYVKAFRAERAALESRGLGAAEIWVELEKLNLGRLRVAAKGLKRDGGQLVPVGADVQKREGMFMIGQIAAARDSIITIEDLHQDVSAGSERILQELSLPSPAQTENRPVEIAIVGMSAIFPGATDLKTFWSNIVGAVDSVTEVPRSRWNAELYFDANSNDGERTPCKWGGFLPDVMFDPLSFGIPPKSLSAIDPAQLLSLEVARRALADAGYLEREFDRERASVIFGAEGGTDLSTAYSFRAMYPQLLGPMPEPLAQHLPTLTEDSFAGVLSNVISGRIANRLDLGGVNYTVDAACASSLAALDLAVKELNTGSSDMVLCGGADLHNGINDYLMFSSVHALSRRGRCRTFDADADGIVLGEGVACVVLKRLSDAERDGDRIYAVLRGVAGASDGRSLGLTAPRKEGQMRALERTYRQAQVSPAEVGLVEAHGTGTVVGDRTELASITEVFQRSGARTAQTAIGSVKSQIGHTKCTAGLAGLIKAALSLYHRVLPPTLHIQNPNPAYDRATSPFVLSNVARPWLTPASGSTRKAAVSAFGFGGTNFHAVLAEYSRSEPPAAGGVRFPSELFLIRGETAADAARRAGELLRKLPDGVPHSLSDLAFTIGSEGKGPVQLAIVAQDLDDLRRKLGSAERLSVGEGVYAARVPPGQLAFLFPGQGSQRPGMLSDFFVAFPTLQRTLELGRKWADLIFPPPGFDEAEREAQVQALTDTRVAQPALGVVELAMLDLLASLGITPDLVGGHSYGELVALCAAGTLSPKDLLELSEARAQCILSAVGEEPGAMAAVTAPLEKVRQLFQGTDISLVNENSPTQAVIAGPRASIDAALEKLIQQGLSAQKLQVACAFHSSLLRGADAAFAVRLSEIDVHAPALPVFANATAGRYPNEVEGIRDLLARQLVSPVRFADEVEAMYAAGARIFLEVGPGQVLTRLVGRILGERPHLALSMGREGRAGIPQLLEVLAELAVHAVPVQLATLFAGRQVRRIDLNAPLPKPSASLWRVNGHLSLPAVGEQPPGSLRVNAEPFAIAAPPSSAPVAPSISNRETPVLAYLQSMQQLADAQREVMLRFLGSEPVDAPRAERVRRVEAPAKVVSSKASVAAVAKPAQTHPEPAPVTPSESKPDLIQLLLTLVSERTGYPAAMLNPDADLEAELSIDSIKRIEILGALTQRLGIPKGGATGMAALGLEKLAAVKTLRGIATFLEQRLNQGSDASTTPKETATRSATNGHSADGHAESAALGNGQPANARPANGHAEHATANGQPANARPANGHADQASANGQPSNGQSANGHADQGPANAQSSSGQPTNGQPTNGQPANGHADHAPANGHLGDQPGASADASGHSVNGNGREAIYWARRDWIEVPPSLSVVPTGRRYWLVPDSLGVASQLADKLLARGMTVHVQTALPSGGVNTLVDLTSLTGGHAELWSVFDRCRQAIAAGASELVALTGLGGFGGEGARLSRACELAGAGVAGILKSLSHEQPGLRVRAIDLDPTEPPEPLSHYLIANLMSPDSATDTAWYRGVRRAVAFAAVPMPKLAVPLSPESVVLMTGGARGITAHLAIALARRFRCNLELVGRRPFPDEEPAELASYGDLPGLRKALLSRGIQSIAQVEAEAQKIWAGREIRRTLAAIAAASGQANYRAVDVARPDAVQSMIQDIYSKCGRIDAVFHGAGVTDDRSFAAKQRTGFDRVVATKLGGALALVRHLRPDVRLCVFFGSVSGVYGNRGQVDYAAANDALDRLAAAARDRFAGPTVSLDFGPWAGAGMVSPELAREYERRQIPLIPLDRGVQAIVEALFEGDPAEARASWPAHWIVTASPAESFIQGVRRETSAPAADISGPTSVTSHAHPA